MTLFERRRSVVFSAIDDNHFDRLTSAQRVKCQSQLWSVVEDRDNH